MTPSTSQSPMHRSSRRLRYLVWALIAAALLALGTVPRLQASQEAKTAAAQSAVAKVRVVNPDNSPGTSTISMPGTLEAWTEASIRARSSGYVEHWYADIGAQVTAGQTLATLVAPELEAGLRQARDEQATAQANFDIAATTAARWQAMLRQKATSAQEAEQRGAELNARRAELSAAKANVVRLAQSVTYTRLVAPFDGVITSRAVDVGTLVDAGAPTELFHEVQSSRLRLVLSVPDAQAAAVRCGMAVQVEVGSRLIDAKVARTAGAIDLASRMQRVEVDLPNADGTLLPGQYVRVLLSAAAHAPGSIVPVEAVLYRPAGPQIAVVGSNQEVALRKVHVRQDLGTRLLVDPPLAADTRLVANPGDSIASGDRVEIVADAKSTGAVHRKGDR